MPIYMDRHYVEDATRHAVEHAHERDLELQDKYGCKFLTYWFDDARHTAFCLVDSPDADTLKAVHAEAHGLIPHEIIPVDATAVEAFLGRITDPVPTREDPTPHADAAFRTIMFTDLKDSTSMGVRLGDEKAMYLLRVHNALIREQLTAHNGREVKSTGDGFLLSFAAMPDAVRCAVAIQDAFASYNQAHPDEPLAVRIGLSAGEPVEERGDLFGTPVNLASRICNAAAAGQILAAAIVREECRCEEEGLRFVDAGRLDLKGFDEPVPVFAVEWRAG